jgi:hypothetical protein
METFFKPFVRRPYRKVVSKVPLAENPSSVTRCFEILSDSNFFFADDTAAVVHFDGTRPFRIATREKGRPSGCTEGLDIEVGELRALASQAV